MTVTALRLKNFMAFRDTKWIELRSITLLFGRNSSGKSAIIRALRLLKQSLKTSDNKPLDFDVEGQLNLGDFATALHTRNPPFVDDWSELESNKMTFAFRCELDGSSAQFVREFIEQKYVPQSGANAELSTTPEFLEFTLQFGYDEIRKEVILVSIYVDYPHDMFEGDAQLELLSLERLGVLEQREDRSLPQSVEWKPRWIWNSDFDLGIDMIEGQAICELVEWESTNGFLPVAQVDSGTLFTKVHNEISDVQFVHKLTSGLSTTIQDFLNSIEFLGPIRPEPRRLYQLDQHEVKRWEAQGLQTWIQFLKGTLNVATVDTTDRDVKLYDRDEGEKHIESSPRNDTPEMLQTLIDAWFRILNLGSHVRANRTALPDELALTSQVFIYKSSNEKDKENLADVGYGASQVLPIITACVGASSGSMIITEQPELHLHPGAQSALGDLYIETSKNGVRVLIETHSEHLLLRLRRRVAETAVGWFSSKNPIKILLLELNILYVSRGNIRSILELVEIDSQGDIIRPPEFQGFFADDLDEIAAIAEASLLKSELGD